MLNAKSIAIPRGENQYDLNLHWNIVVKSNLVFRGLWIPICLLLYMFSFLQHQETDQWGHHEQWLSEEVRASTHTRNGGLHVWENLYCQSAGDPRRRAWELPLCACRSALTFLPSSIFYLLLWVISEIFYQIIMFLYYAKWCWLVTQRAFWRWCKMGSSLGRCGLEQLLESWPSSTIARELPLLKVNVWLRQWCLVMILDKRAKSSYLSHSW